MAIPFASVRIDAHIPVLIRDRLTIIRMAISLLHAGAAASVGVIGLQVGE
jgi:hypothetical protein